MWWESLALDTVLAAGLAEICLQAKLSGNAANS